MTFLHGIKSLKHMLTTEDVMSTFPIRYFKNTWPQVMLQEPIAQIFEIAIINQFLSTFINDLSVKVFMKQICLRNKIISTFFSLPTIFQVFSVNSSITE